MLKIYITTGRFLVPHIRFGKRNNKKFPAAETLAFSLDFLFRRDQNHYSNLKTKIVKMCEQILKKTAPQYDSNSLNYKKIRSAIITAANNNDAAINYRLPQKPCERFWQSKTTHGTNRIFGSNKTAVHH